MNVLIAEDDENSRLMLETALSAFGFQVLAVVNGQEAMHAVNVAPPDLIISDILMPKLDGFGLCRQIKADPRFRDIPFIFYTATFTDSRDEELGLALGAQRFLIKPMEVGDLLAAVRQVYDAAQNAVEIPIGRAQDAKLSAMQIEALSRKLEQKVQDLEAANRSLQVSEERLRLIADHIRECFWVTSADGRELEYASAAFRTIWGFAPEPGSTTPAACMAAIHLSDRARMQARFAHRGDTRPREDRYRIVLPDASVRWVRDYAVPILNANGAVDRIVGVTEDVTEAQVLTDELHYQASRDPLTGLINRAVFDERLTEAIASANERNTHHALCYLDLDQFKVVNDTCGHIAGDALLKALALELKQVTRPQDTLARMGGDEFALLLNHCALDEVERICDGLRRVVENFRFDWDGVTFGVAVSIGLVEIAADAGCAREVLSAADFACYAAKEYGRNRIHLYRKDDPDIARRLDEMQWVSRINKAIKEGRFHLYFQRIEPVAGGAVATGLHCELLVRMVSESGESILPGKFLPAAERYNLAPKLDRWVIRQALSWLSAAAQRDRIAVCSINLSGLSVADDSMFAYIEEQVTAAGVPPGKLCFEITETSAVTRLEAARSLCERLRNFGCSVALDDFGAGVSSFVYLKNFAADIIKIEGAFVRGLLDNPVDYAIVKGITEISQRLDKRTVAESVENAAILAAVREIGVDFVQGYALGYPEPCV